MMALSPYEQLMSTTASRLSSPDYFVSPDRIGIQTLETVLGRMELLKLFNPSEVNQTMDDREVLSELGVAGIVHALAIYGEFSPDQGKEYLPWVMSPQILEKSRVSSHSRVADELVRLLPHYLRYESEDKVSALSAHALRMHDNSVMYIARGSSAHREQRLPFEKAAAKLSMANFQLIDNLS